MIHDVFVQPLKLPLMTGWKINGFNDRHATVLKVGNRYHVYLYENDKIKEHIEPHQIRERCSRGGQPGSLTIARKWVREGYDTVELVRNAYVEETK